MPALKRWRQEDQSYSQLQFKFKASLVCTETLSQKGDGVDGACAWY